MSPREIPYATNQGGIHLPARTEPYSSESHDRTGQVLPRVPSLFGEIPMEGERIGTVAVLQTMENPNKIQETDFILPARKTMTSMLCEPAMPQLVRIDLAPINTAQ